MLKLSLEKLAQITNATLINSKTKIYINDISTDSRQETVSGLFCAIIGEKFDAHENIEQAIKKGAKALLVSKEIKTDIPYLKVKNTIDALFAIAKYLRQKINPKICAITGSVGKTSVKEMVFAILKEKDLNTIATNLNFNNKLGATFTLLRLQEKTKYLVLELGANHKGEIAFSTRLATPDVALINNVDRSHTLGFGDVDEINKAKEEIFSTFNKPITAIINTKNKFSSSWLLANQNNNILKCSIDKNIKNIKLDEKNQISFDLIIRDKKTRINLPIKGEHNIENALNASFCAFALGANIGQIKQGLENIKPIKGRLEFIDLGKNITLIDDSYNSSFRSTKAGIDLLVNLNGKKICLIADMFELGDFSKIEHQKIGDLLQKIKIDEILTLGKDSKIISSKNKTNSSHFTCKENAQEHLINILKKASSSKEKLYIYLKGSRFFKLEEIACNLVDYYHLHLSKHKVF